MKRVYSSTASVHTEEAFQKRYDVSHLENIKKNPTPQAGIKDLKDCPLVSTKSILEEGSRTRIKTGCFLVRDVDKFLQFTCTRGNPKAKDSTQQEEIRV